MKYHIRLDQEMLAGAEHVILPGDPARVAKTALHLDPQAKPLAQNREYTSYLAKVKERNILVCSTGIGGPSVAICLEELASLGVKYFYRIGTTGAIQPHIEVPSVIISTGAVRLDGASFHYAPAEYPAVSDYYLTGSLVNAAKELNLPHYLGITASSDTFYPGQERYDTYTGYVIRKFQKSMEEWQRLHVLNFEMEAATLFTVISAFGLQAACVCSAIVNRTKSEIPNDEVLGKAELYLAQVIKKAIELHIDTL